MEVKDPKAVLVCNDAERASTLTEILESGGITVKVATSVEQGLESTDEDTDVILLDLNMGSEPDLLCRRFTLAENTRKIPLVALDTPPLSDKVVSAALSAGAIDVVSVKTSPDLLLTRVRNFVHIHQEEVKLAETEKRYRRIFDSSHNGYFLATRGGRFLEVNDAMIRMLGYSSKSEVLNLKLPDDLYANPDDRNFLMEIVQKQGFVKDYKVDFKRKDGSVLTILLTANLYRSPDGTIIGIEGVNIPLMDVRESLWSKMKSFFLSPFGKKNKGGGNFMSVSRVSELIADRYEKIEELSEGRYSSVWRGRDILGFEDAPLVIKVSKSEALNDRFLLEARVLNELAGHPGIPELIAIARHRGRVVLITRFVEGKTLSEAIATLGERERDRTIYQLLDTVAHMHSYNIVHRDIKPENIMLRPNGQIVLLDFGIVRRMEDSDTSATVIGTRPFMAPEQVNGKSERRSDIWALGVVLYLLYTGRMPFSGATEMELMENILKVDPPSVRSINPDLPDTLDAIILRALEKEPDKRYQTAIMLRDDLIEKVPGFREHVVDLF